ncbi:hypothetical protein K8Z61_11415 [Nocardioides sp. TRM66260-LWL]|uniref:divisome protein SepX/GlpR n=1 Tax=Nocardioides sp. TRM66260-LWL TaxID=2874478 RepID=UPI001CC60534|nr:hypothetical protein [Nocardioides sp. TRM66260-LWL]MBZ5735107.1 hypothetical protein [Nocardioides sp. TRM66260-LWL]
MDLSGLIFVALAVAWAAYLVPKALRYHEDVHRSRSIDRFSTTMRVLARREPTDRGRARLVVTPGRTPEAPAVQAPAPRVAAPTAATSPATSPAAAAAAAAPAADEQRRAEPVARRVPPAVRREAARRAAQRRRRVLGTLTGLLLAVVALAAAGVVGWAWTSAPIALLIAWLVACRLMVRQERGLGAVRRPARSAAERVRSRPSLAEAAATAVEDASLADLDPDLTSEVPVVSESAPVDAAVVDGPVTAPGLWDPVPVTLPTYVAKPAAVRRSVRTIDLDSTGVWTSGRTEADASIAREADEQRRRDVRRSDEGGRATGS